MPFELQRAASNEHRISTQFRWLFSRVLCTKVIGAIWNGGSLVEAAFRLCLTCSGTSRCTLRSFQTAGSGLLDVSKDGRLAVDGTLQVFDVHSGRIVVSFSAHRWAPHHTAHADDHYVKLVRLTADGKYVGLAVSALSIT